MSKTKIKHNRELSLSPLEITRLLSKATQQNKLGQYYNTDSAGQKIFGYHAWQTGDWVCYTCGLLCNCERESELVLCGDCLRPDCYHLEQVRGRV